MIKSGDIVCATYGDFNGEKRVGVFLVIYSERFDRIYTSGHTNLTCAKITTNNLLGNSYTVRIKKGDANMDNECLVNLSKLHTFTKEQVYKTIGTVNADTMLKVFKEVRAFNNEVEQQLLDYVA